MTTLKPTEIDSTQMCPMPTHEDKVPSSPDPFLSSLLKQYNDCSAVSKQGKKLEGQVHLVGRICSAITEYWEEGQDMTTSTLEHGWPLKIEFKKIPQQIMKLKNRIRGVVANEFVLNDSVA